MAFLFAQQQAECCMCKKSLKAGLQHGSKQPKKFYINMENATLLQFFHWYYPQDGSLWNNLKADAKQLAEKGITAVWLPPASKRHRRVFCRL
jgi:alpha-amylase